jgi:Cu2+-exporting ATPase
MGKGVPLSQAHADYILLNGDISQIPQLIKHAKKTMLVIQQNIAWAVVYNLVCIPLAFVGVLSPWLAGLGMAASSIIVILNALRLTKFSTSTTLAKAT